MKKVVTLTLAGAAAVLLSAIPAVAAGKPVAKSVKTMAKAPAVRRAWRPETLSGKVAMVDPNQRLVVVQLPDGVLFDMVVTRRTRIESGGQAITLKNLGQYENRNVSIRFVPERRGDVASSIQVSG
jgi:hypothetical protein